MMDEEDWKAEYECLRQVPGRGLCGLHTFMFTTGLLVGLDEMGYYGRYCYASYADACKALREWGGVGDPPGPWIKYKGPPAERLGPGAGDKFEFDRAEN